SSRSVTAGRAFFGREACRGGGGGGGRLFGGPQHGWGGGGDPLPEADGGVDVPTRPPGPRLPPRPPRPPPRPPAPRPRHRPGPQRTRAPAASEPGPSTRSVDDTRAAETPIGGAGHGLDTRSASTRSSPDGANGAPSAVISPSRPCPAVSGGSMSPGRRTSRTRDEATPWPVVTGKVCPGGGVDSLPHGPPDAARRAQVPPSLAWPGSTVSRRCPGPLASTCPLVPSSTTARSPIWGMLSTATGVPGVSSCPGFAGWVGPVGAVAPASAARKLA